MQRLAKVSYSSFIYALPAVCEWPSYPSAAAEQERRQAPVASERPEFWRGALQLWTE